MLDPPSFFNAIIGLPSQVKFNMRCVNRSLTLTFETPRGDAFIYAPQLPTCKNYVATMSTSSKVERPDKEDETMEDTAEPRLDNIIDDVEVVVEKKFQIGKDLINPNKEKLIHLLKAHLDVLA